MIIIEIFVDKLNQIFITLLSCSGIVGNVLTCFFNKKKYEKEILLAASSQ